MKWNRGKVIRLRHKKGPKNWKERMAIEYSNITGMHSAAAIMNKCETDPEYRANILKDYKDYLIDKALT